MYGMQQVAGTGAERKWRRKKRMDCNRIENWKPHPPVVRGPQCKRRKASHPGTQNSINPLKPAEKAKYVNQHTHKG